MEDHYQDGESVSNQGKILDSEELDSGNNNNLLQNLDQEEMVIND